MTDKECIFCKIAGGEIPSSTVYEDDDFRVILDLGPASKGHALILPKQHFKDLCELDPAIAAKALPLAGKIGAAMKKALGCTGFNVVQNNGISAGQTVFHFHDNIPWLDEVSIGHALICDALYLGLKKTIEEYKNCLR